MNPSQNNSQVGLRLKSRAVLNFSTPGGMSNAMSRMRVMGTPGGPPGGSQLSQDPSQPLGMPRQPAPPEPISASQMMMSQGMTMFTPDYQTPAEAQFACNMDPNVAPDKENRGRIPRAPPPQRNKRILSAMIPPRPRTPSSDPSPWARSPRRDGTRSPACRRASRAWRVAARTAAAPRGHPPIPEPRKTPGGRAPAPHNFSVSAQPLPRGRGTAREVPAHRRSGNPPPCRARHHARLRADFVDLASGRRILQSVQVYLRLTAPCTRWSTERKLQSEREKQEALREVLGGGPRRARARRYFGAWMEHDHLYVQLELCDGTLADQFTASMRKAARDRERDERSGGADSQSNASMPDALDDPEDADAFVFGEREILVVMRHVALALSAAHARGVAHLDVKPDNILTPATRTNSQTGAAPRPWTAWGT